MKIEDDGTKLTITSTPGCFVKGFGCLFLSFAALFPLMVVLSFVLPPEHASIDADRSRGTVVFSLQAWTKTVPLAEVKGAKVIHSKGSRNDSPHDFVEVETTKGEKFHLTESSYTAPITSGMRTAVAGFEQFLGDATQPSYKTTFVASDTDWPTMICFTILSPLAAWVALSFWTARRIELDRAARTVRVAVKAKLRRATETTLGFDDITSIYGVGASWIRIGFATRTETATVPVLVVPRGSSEGKNVVALLAAATGAKLEGEAAKLV